MSTCPHTTNSVHSLLRARVQPTVDPSDERPSCRSNAPAYGEEENWYM